MRKIILILILQLFFCNQIFAEEIKTRLGYSFKLSKGYTMLTNENLNKLIDNYNEKKMKDVLGNEFSINFFNDLQCNPSNQFAKQECIFSDELSPQFNVIIFIITADGGKLPPNNEANRKAGCAVKHTIYKSFLDMMNTADTTYINENIEQHDCYYTDVLKPKFNESLYSAYDGFLKDQLLFEYVYQLPSGMGITLVQCSHENCIQLLKEGIKITKSISKIPYN